MAVVRVTKACVVTVNGIPQALRENEPFDSDDQVVREFPWAFGFDNVEEATAAPGERRNVRR